MSKFSKQKVMPRYFIVAVALVLVGIAVIAKAAYTMTAEKEWWAEVANNQIKTADSIKLPNRGNILSCDGELLAGSIPEYEMYIDFRAGLQKLDDGTFFEDTAWVRKRAELWMEKIDSICDGLHRIFPQKSAEDFRTHLMEGFEKKSRCWRVWRGKVDYVTFNEVKKLPFFNLPRHKCGFYGEEHPARRHPFGSLAERTIGSRDSARYGIELAYDSLLAGACGIAHKQKVRDKMVYVTSTPPIDGADLVTTIDIGMQDLAEQALLKKLKEIEALMGVAIVMEVQTGDVKAIVNMERAGDGTYHELLNNALGYRCEPGSVFKTASILVALDDAVVDTSYVIHTGSGIMPMHGARMRDHNWHRGGYHDINVARALEVSSNIGVSYVIDHFYGSNPTKYVEGLHRVGIGMDLGIPLNEYRAPKIRYPNFTTTNRALYWSKTTLPWMSIGYETQVAPINTLTFYNAIANDGKLMQPRFVKQAVKDGHVIQEFPPVVLKDQIARPEAVKTMQTILTHVVSQGLGKRAGSTSFSVAGKTGTAQVSDKEFNYHTGKRCHWLSFCGYFPADQPRYSCIVCIKTTNGPASGGLQSGSVFHEISEGVMASSVRKVAANARDEHSVFIPEVKNGDVQAADYVLDRLNIKTTGNWMTATTTNSPVWGQAQAQENAVLLDKVNTADDKMPDVKGMGARDAVYLLEKKGVSVQLSGTGDVRTQSIPAGATLRGGMKCHLVLG
ncbi:MAG: transpeptidase family protein [Prevotella sp.]|nr:transpeptidase family protein [Prevotella sp.]